MKTNEPVHVIIGEREYHIFPFPAMKSANLSGELAGMLLPIFGSFTPLAAKLKGEEDSKILDSDLSEIAPLIADAFKNFSGDKVEAFLRKFLLAKNITVEMGNGKVEYLTEDVANEIFCGETQDMFILVFHVIKVNFSGFFKKLAAQFGMDGEMLLKVPEMLKNMASSTLPSSSN